MNKLERTPVIIIAHDKELTELKNTIDASIVAHKQKIKFLNKQKEDLEKEIVEARNGFWLSVQKTLVEKNLIDESVSVDKLEYDDGVIFLEAKEKMPTNPLSMLFGFNGPDAG